MSPQIQTILQVLTFLGTVALVGIGTLATIAFTIARRPKQATLAGLGAGIVVAAYGIALVALGVASRERVLGPGESKLFCEIDCHLAYTVTAVRAASTEHGTRYLVTLRTGFDARTISRQRGEGALWPNPRRVRVVDAHGRAWTAFGTSRGTPIDTPLRPGESYETTFAFDLPATVDAPRLELTEANAVTRLLLGHENSPLHAKTLLALGRGFMTSLAPLGMTGR